MPQLFAFKLHFILLSIYHYVKKVHIWSFFGPYFPALGLNTGDTPYHSVFSPNTGKQGLEKHRIRTIFTLYRNPFRVNFAIYFNVFQYSAVFALHIETIICFAEQSKCA